MRILVTGFGGFPGSPRNPTERIIAGLHRCRPRLARAGLDLDLSVLPVVYGEIEARLAALTRKAPPDAILHFGLAARRTRLTVETRALNRISPVRPDAAGAFSGRRVLSPGGHFPGDSQAGVTGTEIHRRDGAPIPSGGNGQAQSLKSSAPAALIVAKLRRSGFRAAVSIDAGDYVCNQTLFLSLNRHADALVGFIHVPPLASLQRRPGRPEAGRPYKRLPRDQPAGVARRLTPDEAVRAALLIILALIPKLQSRRRSRPVSGGGEASSLARRPKRRPSK